ncbi:MAG: hypothetical protein KatS3mg104_1289 [Phycisphaerae bacterium]|mgnify:CR=1 FL=1|jgi:general secretion pathway protein G|nr:MAG: hypothetical protein KatS3mg104_1289 [Phycisphaerae bacterium]
MLSGKIQNPSFSSSRRGFTLVEILIVVVILGILTAIIVPQFSNASHVARENVLKDDLRYLRTQIGVYKAQHEDIPPGYPDGNLHQTPTGEAFVQQLTVYTNTKGQISLTADPAYPFGPYLSQMPRNPLTGKSGVHVVTTGPMPEPSLEAFPDAGWIYHIETQQIIANSPGTDSQGVAYADY